MSPSFCFLNIPNPSHLSVLYLLFPLPGILFLQISIPLTCHPLGLSSNIFLKRLSLISISNVGLSTPTPFSTWLHFLHITLLSELTFFIYYLLRRAEPTSALYFIVSPASRTLPGPKHMLNKFLLSELIYDFSLVTKSTASGRGSHIIYSPPRENKADS